MAPAAGAGVDPNRTPERRRSTPLECPGVERPGRDARLCNLLRRFPEELDLSPRQGGSDGDASPLHTPPTSPDNSPMRDGARSPAPVTPPPPLRDLSVPPPAPRRKVCLNRYAARHGQPDPLAAGHGGPA